MQVALNGLVSLAAHTAWRRFIEKPGAQSLLTTLSAARFSCAGSPVRPRKPALMMSRRSASMAPWPLDWISATRRLERPMLAVVMYIAATASTITRLIATPTISSISVKPPLARGGGHPGE
jgi:hypothetical protein